MYCSGDKDIRKVKSAMSIINSRNIVYVEYGVQGEITQLSVMLTLL